METLRERKILLVDDDKDILNLMQTYLIKSNFTNILKAENGEKAIDLCRAEKPHIVVLDIMLPDMDGYDVCKEIRTFSVVPILFLSGLSNEIDRIQCFAVGGDDYLAKPFSPREFLYRVKSNLGRLSDRKVCEDKDIIKVGNLEIRLREHMVLKEGKKIDLYPVEYDLLMCFIKNINNIISKEDLINAVLGYEYDGNEENVIVHISRLRKKIEDDTTKPKYIQTIKKVGYKFIG